MLPKIKYLDVHDTLTRQKDVRESNINIFLSDISLKIALAKIREYSKSHIVHDGLHQFKDAPEGFKLDYRDVPGLSEYFF